MANNLSYCPFAFALIWSFFVFTGTVLSQDCGCINCPVDIEDQSISTATFKVDGAANNSLTTNSIQTVLIKFNHSFPSELEMKLISPAGQAVTLIGPLGTSASAVFFGGFNVSFITDINNTDPDPGMNSIWNNADLSGIQQYSGSYLPFSGSLLNFNTGTVNGDWSLEISDPLLFDEGTLEEFEIVFVDQEGIECCEADAGTLEDNMLTACEGDESLNLSISPTFPSGAPNESIYGYLFVITENDVIIDISANPDLRTFMPGLYSVYGFSYDLLDETQIPSPNGSLTLTDFATNIAGNNPIICGDISDEFLEVEILGNASVTFISDTLCNGESIFLGDQEIFTEGIFRDTFNTLSSCDSIVQLEILVGISDTMELFESTCTESFVGVDTFHFANQVGCDSVVFVTTSLLPSDTIFMETETCTLVQDMQTDTLTISTPECDSIIITTFFYELPDTVFSISKTCLPDAVGLDTFFINQGTLCDDIEIRETIMYLIDTTFFSRNTCDENQVGEVIMTFPTDTCDRVEVTTFSLVASDTTFLEIENCNSSLAGVDTLFLSNENNCDSLVITTTTFVDSDTTHFEVFSCDVLDVGMDTIFLSNQFSCDSLVITATFLSLADTTFIMESTCDINQTDPVVEIFATLDCDSLVITTFEFVESDTTFEVGFACEETVADTVLLQNFEGCDSLVITNFVNTSIEPLLLEESTCDPMMVGTRMDTLEGQFCDSIIITNFNLLPADTLRVSAFVCSLQEEGLDTVFLSNTAGCDSLIITDNIFEEVDPTLISNFTCDSESLGLDTLILISESGCDSLVIANFMLAEADTIYAESIVSCNVEEVGSDTLIFATNSCDSVVITNTVFEPLDTTLVELGECDLSQSKMDTINLISALGCDSIIIVTTIPLQASLSTTNVIVNLPSLVRMDTLLLTNAAGCDSLAITNYILETEVPDTVYVEVPTCEFNMEPDTTIGIVGEVIIETFIPIIIDTTFAENQICSESFVENDTIILSSELGCDSVVVSTYLPLIPSETILILSTCDPNQALNDTIVLMNELGCDSLVITNYNIIEIEPTISEEQTCDPSQELVETIVLISKDGCDSVVIVNYELVDVDTMITIVPTCAAFSSDTIFITGSDCPTVEIILFESQVSDTTFINRQNCSGPFGIEFFSFENEFGCDSIVVQSTMEAMQNETITELTSCFENQQSDTLFLTGEFCDSLVITNFVFVPIEPTLLDVFTCDINTAGIFIDTLVSFLGCDSIVITNITMDFFEPTIIQVFTCDPEDVSPDTTILMSSTQCDSLVIFEKNLVDILPPTELISSTCIMAEAGIFRDTFISLQGCDSIIIETVEFIEPNVTLLQEFSCDANEIGLDTTIINNGECPSFLIVETILSDQVDTTFLEESTCDLSLLGEIDINQFISQGGCDSIVVTTFIVEDANFNLDVLIEAPICAGESNGIVDLGLENDMEALWLADQFTGVLRDDLPSGQYEVLISQGACDTIVEIVVPSTPAIFLNLEIDYILCSSIGGFIFSQVSGGQGPYEYLWNDSSTEPERMNLTNGTYVLTVTDGMGCTSVDSVLIQNVLGLEFQANIEHVSCFGNDDGGIEVALMSGTPPYMVEWEDGTRELIRENLGPGMYTATISDVNNCSVIINRIVREPTLLEVDLQINDAGEFEALVSGGTPQYSYAWNDGSSISVIREPILGFGYEVTVTDANGCIAARDEVFSQVSTLDIALSDVSLSPNPNNGTFQLRYDVALDLEQIVIYNIYGQQVTSQITTLNNGSVEINLPKDRKGTFVVDAQFKQGRYHQKLMVF